MAAVSALTMPCTPTDPGRKESLLVDASQACIRKLISTTLSDVSLSNGETEAQRVNMLSEGHSHQVWAWLWIPKCVIFPWYQCLSGQSGFSLANFQLIM